MVSWLPPPGSGLDVFVYRLRWKGPGQRYSDAERWDTTEALSYEITGLANGAKYYVQVAAGIRGVGFGSWSEASGVPRTVPGTPRSPSVTNGDEKLTVSWRAPVTNGGAPVTGYRVEWTSDGVTLGEESATGLNHEIEGLTNGVDYEVRVAAVNEAGAGSWSDEDEGSPVGTPDAPQALSAERGDRSATIEWSPPTDDGSSVITGYKVQWRSGGQVFNASRQSRVGPGVSEYEITGLVNGTEYSVRVIAVNAVGDGTPSTEAAVTPATTPGPPRALRTQRGDSSGKVEWSPPSATGGLSVTGYIVQWSDDEFDQLVNESQVGPGVSEYGITGLVNGTEYFVRVMAVNGAGEGPWSSSASSTPAVLPGPPRSVAVKPANGSIAVTWQAPASTGGSPITGYKVQWRAGSEGYDTSRQAAVTDLEDLSHRIIGLDNGTKYHIRVLAVNAVGNGAAPPELAATPLTSPASPSSVAVERGDRSVTASWEAADDNGSSITGYTVQWRSGDDKFEEKEPQANVGGAVLSRRITGLVNGTEYWVRVRATNSVGTGPWSVAASAVAATVPSSPRSVTTERGDGSITLAWQEPSTNGGLAITGYKVQWRTVNQTYDEESRQALVTDLDDLSYEITDLVNGTVYFVQAIAVNDAGDGAVSRQRSATPGALPDVPGDVTLETRDRSLGVSWTAADDGGSVISGYTVQWRSGDDKFEDKDPQVNVGGAVLNSRITGLVNGTEYWVRVRAVNSLGAGPWSATMSAVAATVPAAPRSISVVPDDGSITVNWLAPANGGSEITGYLVDWRADDEEFSDTERRLTTADAPHQIAELTNGAKYWVRVRAVNAAGTGPAATVSGTPRTVPAQPHAMSITVSPALIMLVSWEPPDSDGGSSVTGYRVQWKGPGQEYNGTDRQVTVTNLRHQISGVTKGDQYTVRIAALNAAGYGAVAEASLVVADPPGAPRSPAVVARNTTLEVSWEAPSDAGGSDIVAYRVLWKGPGQNFDDSRCSFRRITIPVGETLKALIGPLRNGTAYGIRVVAVNDSGPGQPLDFTGTPTAGSGLRRRTGALLRDGSLVADRRQPRHGGSLAGYRVLWTGHGAALQRLDSDTNDQRYATWETT